MSNLEKYDHAFMEAFEIEAAALPELKYQDIPEWDSVGHMALMVDLEEKFDIMMDTDDIIDFSSYQIGKDILAKYDIQL